LITPLALPSRLILPNNDLSILNNSIQNISSQNQSLSRIENLSRKSDTHNSNNLLEKGAGKKKIYLNIFSKLLNEVYF
jgi:hypothetical protein